MPPARGGAWDSVAGERFTKAVSGRIGSRARPEPPGRTAGAAPARLPRPRQVAPVRARSAEDRHSRRCTPGSDDLISRNLRRAQFQHQAQIRARKKGRGRIELLAQFLDRLVGCGIGGMVQAYRQGARIGVWQQVGFVGVEGA